MSPINAIQMFRRLVLVAFVLAVAAQAAFAQSLAEVAKKEKDRRNKNNTESKRVITDRELAGTYRGLRTTTTGAADQPSQASAEGEGDGQASEEEKPDETKTEQYWRDRVKASQEKIARLEQQLQADDWGEGQRMGVDPLGQRNLGQRQQVEQELAAARSELEAIRSEARRAGVPPGWVR